MSYRWIVCIRYRVEACSEFRRPLVCTRCAAGKLPIKAEQILEVIIVPLRRGHCPSPFNAACDGVNTFPAAEAILPAKTLIFYAATFRGSTDELVRVSRTMRFAKRMSARNQRHSLDVVHRHA